MYFSYPIRCTTNTYCTSTPNHTALSTSLQLENGIYVSYRLQPAKTFVLNYRSLHSTCNLRLPRQQRFRAKQLRSVSVSQHPEILYFQIYCAQLTDLTCSIVCCLQRWSWWSPHIWFSLCRYNQNRRHPTGFLKTSTGRRSILWKAARHAISSHSYKTVFHVSPACFCAMDSDLRFFSRYIPGISPVRHRLMKPYLNHSIFCILVHVTRPLY